MMDVGSRDEQRLGEAALALRKQPGSGEDREGTGCGA